MSYIKSILEPEIHNKNIHAFLINEGFERGSNPFGYGECMKYVVNNNFYTTWICIHEDFIYLNVEYNCGGTIAETKLLFKKNNIDNFVDKYYDAIAWVENRMN